MMPSILRPQRKSLRAKSASRKSQMSTSLSSTPPEHQIKTLTLTYPEFCLLIEVVAARAGTKLDIKGDWTRLYKRLGGRA